MPGERITDQDVRLSATEPSSSPADYFKSWRENGWTPDEIAMIARLSSSGLSIPLAAVAARHIMGLGAEDKKLPADVKAGQDWATYEREHPYMAAAKKQLVAAGGVVKGAVSGLTKSVYDPHAAEKASAHHMLMDYLASQEQARAAEIEKRDIYGAAVNPDKNIGLWALARMPGAPLAGQPVYGGPTTAPPQPNMGYDMDIGQAQFPQYDMDIGQAQIGPTAASSGVMGSMNRRKHQ